MGRRRKIVEPEVTEVDEIKTEEQGEGKAVDEVAPIEVEEEPVKEKKAAKNNEYVGSYKVIPDGGLNLRSGAGKINKVVTILPKNATVECKGEYKEAQGNIWLGVVVTINGKKYNGYCISSFLNKIEK